MASLKHNLEYILTRSAFAFAGLLTPRAADRFAAALGNLGYRLLTSRRRVAEDNLRRAEGINLSEAEIGPIVRKVFQNVTRTFIETARFGKLKPEGVRRIVFGEGEKYLRQALEYGKGALLLTAHFGNWELLGAWAAASGYKIDHLVGIQHNEKVHDLWNDCRRSMGAGIIEVSRSTLREVFEALKANHVIGYAADQHAPAQNLILDFFGRKAAVASGPARFAVKTGCAVLPMMLRRERFDRHVLIAAEPVFPPNTGNEKEDVLTVAKSYLKFWEDVIRQYPDQWMWTHRRWKV
ncbi:MAG: lysophospholipid acyltransferase family protein [Candidatus Zixiibacteriota bacterium]|nr:MAG: lysophospholipid acyltransferase family protein [candidate division Zixibacteria bacterium]